MTDLARLQHLKTVFEAQATEISDQIPGDRYLFLAPFLWRYLDQNPDQAPFGIIIVQNIGCPREELPILIRGREALMRIDWKARPKTLSELRALIA